MRSPSPLEEAGCGRLLSVLERRDIGSEETTFHRTKPHFLVMLIKINKTKQKKTTLV